MKARVFFVVGTVLIAAARCMAAGGYEIVPGMQIGHVRLNESFEGVAASIGQPKDSDAAMGHSWSWWESGKGAKYELDVYAERDGVRDPAMNHSFVHEIRVTSPVFRTREGIRVGSTVQEIRKVFPQTFAVRRYQSKQLHGWVYLYDDVRHGIAFEVWPGRNGGRDEGQCVAVIVHVREDEAEQQYYPRETYSSTPWALTPGSDMGELSLYGARKDFQSLLGAPVQTLPVKRGTWMLWKLKGQQAKSLAALFGKERVECIRVTSPRFVTATGVRVGSRLSEILRSFPHAADAGTLTLNNHREEIYNDPDNGIAFEFAGHPSACSRCLAITIHLGKSDIPIPARLA